VKALSKWNPEQGATDLWRPSGFWDPFQRMEDEMAMLWRQMDSMMGRSPMKTREGKAMSAWTPRVDITEDEKEYLVKAELPEVKKDEMKVFVRDQTLSITGERTSEKEEKGKKFHRIERETGRFERAFSLPQDADAAKITSEFKDGVLQVHLPKVPGVAPKAIEVKVS